MTFYPTWLLLSLLLLSSFTNQAQELNCKVTIDAERIQASERSIFKDMETAFAEFMNKSKWTDHTYLPQEKITCNLLITLDPEQTDLVAGRFSASVQVISSRPIHSTDYQSVLFNFADRDWIFEYQISQPLFFNENSFTSNITSLLAYYAYIILGFDYDSFSKNGGEPYFRKAWQVVTLAQQSGYPGWEQFNSIRNRYWLAENIINSQMSAIREASYHYHLKGLDVFQEKPDEARTEIFNAIKNIYTVNKARPRAILTISFMDAKATEIAQIFSEGDPVTRKNAYNLLILIDPTKRETFAPLIK